MPRSTILAKQAWAACQTCSINYPADQVYYNPVRKGWQCYKCWDGLFIRDQVQTPIFPGEGTRRTPAPLTNTLLEGVDPDDNYTRVTLGDWAAGFPALDLVLTDFMSFEPSITNFWPAQCLYLNNGWSMFVQQGFMGLTRIPQNNGIQWSGAGDLFVDVDGFLNYTPYVQQLV